jgi:hypothetical protein
MRAALLSVLLVTACKIDLDHASTDAANANGRLCPTPTTTQTCTDAEAMQTVTLSWVQSSIMKPKCTFMSCHDGGVTPQGKMDLTSAAMTYAHLVNGASVLDPSRKLVVPGNIQQSFLMVMIGAIKPEEADPPLSAIPKDTNGKFVGLMPMSSTVMCCQKLDAIGRWITDGALNN